MPQKVRYSNRTVLYGSVVGNLTSAPFQFGFSARQQRPSLATAETRRSGLWAKAFSKNATVSDITVENNFYLLTWHVLVTAQRARSIQRFSWYIRRKVIRKDRGGRFTTEKIYDNPK
jgi:hypothetical protein